MSRFTDLLGQFSAERRFLAVLEPWDGAIDAVVPVYLSSHGFISEPADTPANTYYAPRIMAALTFERSLYSSGRLSGRSVPGAGTLIIANADGELDHLAELAWGGRRVRVYLGGADFALAEYGLIYDGTAQGLSWGDAEITVNLRDLTYVLDREIQSAKYAGTGGVEGGTDLKARRKPDAWGICRNVEPIYLGPDSGQHRFAVASGPIVGVLGVYDRGAALAYDPTPTAGEWSVDLATGVITLGGAYNGPVTCDVIGRRYLAVTSATSASIGTGPQTLSIGTGHALVPGMRVRIASAANPAGEWMDGPVFSYAAGVLRVTVDAVVGSVTASDWTISPWGTVAGIGRAIAAQAGVTVFDDAALAALDLYQPATVGLWLPEGGNGLSILDQIANGSGCHWGFDRSGAFEMGRLSAPTTPQASYDATQVLSLERQATAEPAHEVTVRYRRNWRPLTTDQLAGVAMGTETWWSQEWRQVAASDADVLTAYPLSEPIEIDGIFDAEADAAAEAARQLALFGVHRDYFRVQLKVQPLALELGDTVSVTHARYGLGAGRALRAVDLAEDMDAYEVELGVWG